MIRYGDMITIHPPRTWGKICHMITVNPKEVRSDALVALSRVSSFSSCSEIFLGHETYTAAPTGLPQKDSDTLGFASFARRTHRRLHEKCISASAAGGHQQIDRLQGCRRLSAPIYGGFCKITDAAATPGEAGSGLRPRSPGDSSAAGA